jgi:hypothetical protein
MVPGAVLLLLLGVGDGAAAAPIAAGDGGSGLAASAGLRTEGSDYFVSRFDGNDFEIFRVSGAGGGDTQLTFNDFDDLAPVDSGAGVVVWQGFDGNDFEIFRHDGTDLVQLTSNDADDLGARFAGSDVEWSGFDGNDFEIFRFDGTGVVQLTFNDSDDLMPASADFGSRSDPSSASGLRPLPEPGSLHLLVLGIAALFGWAGRRGGGHA